MLQNPGTKVVLVVDDEADMRPLFEQRFRRHISRGEVRFEFGASGDEALVKLTQLAEVGLILCDIRMPGMDGFEMLEAIRAQRPATPVYLVTGYHGREYVRRAMELGASGYLTKPLDFDELEELISSS
jgi:two-component system, chemotaxis family, chemotaxis protein CheY